MQQEKILVADCDPKQIREISRLLHQERMECHPAYSLEEALRLFHSDRTKPYGLALIDLDSFEVKGWDLLDKIIEQFPATGVIAMALSANTDQAVEVMRRGALDYIVKPFSQEITLRRFRNAIERVHKERDNRAYQRYLEEKVELSTIELFKKHRSMQRLYVNSIESIARAIEAKDPYTQGHSKRVSKFAAYIASQIGLEDSLVSDIEIAGILHDVGKIGISEKILSKPSHLTVDEFEIVKAHPLISLKILDPIEEFANVKSYVTHHHERWDGKGYPAGLKGEEIPLGARILSITDAFDTMWIGRKYHAAWDLPMVMTEFNKNSGTQFDPNLVKIFTGLLSTERSFFERVRMENPPRYRNQTIVSGEQTWFAFSA